MPTTMPSTIHRVGAGVALVAILASGTNVAAQSPGRLPDISPGVPVQLSYPQGETDVILRMATGGGYIPFTFLLTQAPEFTLYGDGTVIYRPAADPEGDGFPPFMQATMTPEQVNDLLVYALGPGGLADARPVYDHRQITDMPWTVFTIDTSAADKDVSVYALAMTQPEGPDADDYASFQALGELLSNFGAVVAKGGATDAGVYQPAAYRAALTPSSAADPAAIPWPWPDLTIDDFTTVGDYQDVLVAAITPEQASQVTTVPSGGVPSIPVLAPDGTAYTLSLRPMLPDETLESIAPTF
jgi:hypothetical protein